MEGVTGRGTPSPKRAPARGHAVRGTTPWSVAVAVQGVGGGELPVLVGRRDSQVVGERDIVGVGVGHWGRLPSVVVHVQHVAKESMTPLEQNDNQNKNSQYTSMICDLGILNILAIFIIKQKKQSR